MEKCAEALGELLPLVNEKRPIVPLPALAPTRNMWIPENEAARSAALETALAREPAIFLATPAVLLSRSITPRSFQKDSFTLRKGEEIAPEEITRKLVEMDYDNEVQVSEPGEFSRRGGILDVFSPLYEAPVRIEFFGNEIDSMRFFLPDTQRSYKETEECKLVPRGTALFQQGRGNTSPVHQFFPEDIQTIFLRPREIAEHLADFFDKQHIQAWDALANSYRSPIFIRAETMDIEGSTAKIPIVRLQAISLSEELSATIPELGDGAAIWHWKKLKSTVRQWMENGYQVIACCAEQGETKRLAEMMQTDPEKEKIPLKIELCSIGHGILLPEAKLALLSGKELFGRQEPRRRRRQLNYKRDTSHEEVDELEEGAFVVHPSHGIAIYHGIHTKELSGELQEVMELEFADDLRLFVPLEQAFLVSKYMGAGKAVPKLSKLGSSVWKRSKDNAEEAAYDLAAELLRIEALRENSQTTAFHPVVEWERSFAESFPWKETPDQEAAIQAVLQDMEQPKPMDRLLCGDVGYGKTEVAIRAAFRAVLNGKQVAILVPTTVLAQQHFQNFKERMAEYPVTIEMLSRFRSTKEIQAIREKTASGEIDILVGTHAILARTVRFRNLGLLIIDEEQRFGVKQKQKLKAMRADLDILTMSATPIPRTLYFSLAGIRNLSTIMTPPDNRLPVATIVATWDKDLIRSAIRRELERQGQIYFLYNRVKTIDNWKEKLEELVPEARIVVAHGQMSPQELEDIMLKFVRHEYDLLLCTTIIESGLDIPNVNTIIIDRADRFGLSELYQLRGRVGRTDRQAYAYMLLPPMSVLSGDARERISAIRRYTNLGAGFKLAMRDLEIRGAGNILGAEQSGHIAAIGFDLYCQLLKEAVSRLTLHQPEKKRQDCILSLDLVTFAISSSPAKLTIGFPSDFIVDANQRIDFYRKIHNLRTEKELQELAEELQDRFGTIPPQAEQLLEYHRLRILANQKELRAVSTVNHKLLVETSRGLLRDSTGQLPVLHSSTGVEQLQEIIRFVRAL